MMKSTVLLTTIFALLLATAGTTGWNVETTVSELVMGLEFLDRQTGFSAGAKDMIGPRILKTTNGGSSWYSVLDDQPCLGLIDVAVEDRNRAYACGCAGLTLLQSIIRTTDGGVTWNGAWQGSMFSYYTDLQVVKPGYVIASGYLTRMLVTKYGILYSKNGGDTWTSYLWNWNDYPDIAWPTDICFLDENYGFAAGGQWPWVEKGGPGGYTPDGVVLPEQGDDPSLWYAVAEKTTDGGATWTTVFLDQGYTLTDVHFVNKNEGWMSGYYNSQFDGPLPYAGWIYHTTNAGNSWERQHFPKEDQVAINEMYMFNRREGWAAGNNAAFTNRSEFYHTTDGGETWIEDSCHAFADIMAIKFFDESEGWAVGPNNAQQSKFIRYTDPSRVPKFVFYIRESPETGTPGEDLSWKIRVENVSGQVQHEDVWISVTSPKLGVLSPYPVLLMEDAAIPANLAVNYTVTVGLPAEMPSGIFNFETIIGPYESVDPYEILAYTDFDVTIQ